MTYDGLTIKISIENEEEIKAKLTAIRQNIDEVTNAVKRLNEMCDEMNGVDNISEWVYSKFYMMPECYLCKARPFKGYIPSLEEVKREYKFCPSCGAKMIESEEYKI